MRKLALLLLLAVISTISVKGQDIIRCISTEVQTEVLKDPFYKKKYDDIQLRMAEKLSQVQSNTGGADVTIPVVFHVIHGGSPIGNAAIMDQLQQINDDYSLSSSDSGDIPAEFIDLAVDTGISFELADTDPDGNSTSGIVHHTHADLGIDPSDCWTQNYIDTNVKAATIWDNDNYLNVWVIDDIEDFDFLGNCVGGILGYGTFPGGPADADGVVILESTVGSLGNPNPAGGAFDLGRTLTHEIGHYLDIFHIWGDDGNACTGSDMIDDTPNAAGPNFGCPGHPSASCSSNDMFMNYMDYVDDDCYRMFTGDQCDRMQTTLEVSRPDLGETLICDPTDSPNFEIEVICDDGTWQVKATALDLDPQNHWWGLYQTSEQGEVDDDHTIAGPIGGIRNGTETFYGWLDQSKRYYIKHGIWTDDCYTWRERRIPVDVFETEPAYHFEDESGNEKDVFCVGEDIFLDGRDSELESRYYIDVWRRWNSNQDFQWYAGIGWTIDQEVGLINISEELANLNQAKYFEPGIEYQVKLATTNPGECRVWTEVLHEFKVECCDGFFDPSFDVNIFQGSNGFRLSANSFDTFPNQNVTNEFYLVSSPNANGGPYTGVKSQVGRFGTRGLDYGVHYTLIQKLSTPCGDFCYQIEIFIPEQGAQPEISVGPASCDLVDEVFPCTSPAVGVLFSCEGGSMKWAQQANVDGYRLRIIYNDSGCCETDKESKTVTYRLSKSQNTFTLPESDYDCVSIQLGTICDGDTNWGEKQCFSCCKIEKVGKVEFECSLGFGSIEPVEGASRYVVQYIWDGCCNEGGQNNYLYLDGDRNFFTLEVPGKVRCVYMRYGAYCPDGTLTWGEWECFDCGDPVKVPPRDEDGDGGVKPIEVRAAPNPAVSLVRLSVKTEIDAIGVFNVYSKEGELIQSIKSPTNQSTEVDVSRFPAGLYLFNFESEGLISEMQKFIVLH